MKKIVILTACLLCYICCFAQRPSKEQIEKDKKAYAEAQKKLDEQLSKMDPKARKAYDSMMNAMGAGVKINEYKQAVNTNATTIKNSKNSVGLVPEKNTKAIAAIGATPTTSGMGAFVGKTNNTVFAAMLPAAKNKANEIYKALKQKGADSDEIGNAATALWMAGRTQIAFGVMAQVCSNDANNTDNLSNYASMLTMMGTPELAIPILKNLNARFKKNTTLLNNLGQAWFALGEIDKANKYLDSTLLLNANHAQANETKCLIAESKGNKTAAVAHAKAAFKNGKSDFRKNKLNQFGYKPSAADYGSFPPANKSNDLLQLGGFAMPAFPKSVAECKTLAPIWKQFRADIDARLKPLQKLTEESNKAMAKQLEEQQKQFMSAMNKSISNPGSVSQSSALQIARVPLFSEAMNMRQNIVLQNLQQKKQAVLQRINQFVSGEGATLKKKYQEEITKIEKKWELVGEGGSVNNEQLCADAVKASNDFLNPYNTKLEGLYNEYLSVDKQLLNEIAYSSLYTTYPEMLPGVIAGLQMQWLRNLSLTQNGFNFESVTKYQCTEEVSGKGGKLTAFKDPNCTINSEFSQTLGISNLGFSIKLTCTELTTSFNALAFGLTLNQDLDHAGFGDSFKDCTVSIGPKTGVDVKMGPVQASANVGTGVDITIDGTGVKDVVVKGSMEAEAGMGPASASAGVEGRMSLNTGAGSLQGTGIFN